LISQIVTASSVKGTVIRLKRYVELETDAVTLRSLEGELIPGLLALRGTQQPLHSEPVGPTDQPRPLPLIQTVQIHHPIPTTPPRDVRA
jgi:hypothetical protein